MILHQKMKQYNYFIQTIWCCTNKGSIECYNLTSKVTTMEATLQSNLFSFVDGILLFFYKNFQLLAYAFCDREGIFGYLCKFMVIGFTYDGV